MATGLQRKPGSSGHWTPSGFAFASLTWMRYQWERRNQTNGKNKKALHRASARSPESHSLHLEVCIPDRPQSLNCSLSSSRGDGKRNREVTNDCPTILCKSLNLSESQRDKTPHTCISRLCVGDGL